MIRRISSSLLWLYAGWTLDGLVGSATGTSEQIGLAIGAVMALVVASDRLPAIWTKKPNEIPPD